MERGREEGRDVWKDSLVGLVVTAMAGGGQAAHTGTGHPPQLVYPASCLSSTRCGQMLALSVPAGCGHTDVTASASRAWATAGREQNRSSNPGLPATQPPETAAV